MPAKKKNSHDTQAYYYLLTPNFFKQQAPLSVLTFHKHSCLLCQTISLHTNKNLDFFRLIKNEEGRISIPAFFILLLKFFHHRYLQNRLEIFGMIRLRLEFY